MRKVKQELYSVVIFVFRVPLPLVKYEVFTSLADFIRIAWQVCASHGRPVPRRVLRLGFWPNLSVVFEHSEGRCSNGCGRRFGFAYTMIQRGFLYAVHISLHCSLVIGQFLSVHGRT